MLANVKLEIYENGISWIQILLEELILNGTAKTKSRMLTFLYCGEFVKTSIEVAITPLITGILMLK